LNAIQTYLASNSTITSTGVTTTGTTPAVNAANFKAKKANSTNWTPLLIGLGVVVGVVALIWISSKK
jgi:hypothetical protein